MKKQARHLYTSELRMGMSVLADVYSEIVVGEIAGMTDIEILVKWENHVGKYLPYTRVRPILRKLSTLTEQEARECYRLSRGEKFKVKGWDGEKRSAIAEVSYGDYLEGIYQSDIDRAIYGIEVVDYLESAGIDTRGWIDKGMAIDAATLQAVA